MATLEVHDSRGRVQFIELTHDHPLLFGTSAACDVVLEGAGIRPVHGRVRWKNRRYKVEASPDAEYVMINGTRMTAGSIRQGDEIGVGACRMFLLRLDEEDMREKPGPRPKPDRKRNPIAAAPINPVESERETPPRKQPARSPGGALPPRQHESILEQDDWLYALQMPVTKGKEKEKEKKEKEREKDTDKEKQKPPAQPGNIPSAGVRAKEAAPPSAKSAGAWPKLRAVLKRLSNTSAPGRERIASSPLVLGLLTALLVLVVMGFWLKAIIASNAATKSFNTALQDFEDGDYRTSIRNFDTFLATNPRDERSGKARVVRALANVRQYVSPEGSTWSSALEAASEMVEKVGKLPEFRDEQSDLAELILRIGEGLADRARISADAAALAEAESTVGLHARVEGKAAPDFLNRSRLPSKLADARAAVRKAQIYTAALSEMDAALKEKAAPRVYAARDTLVDRYADLSHDRELVKRMTAANELVRSAVTIDQTRRAAESKPRPDPLGPPLSLVLRSRHQGTPGDPSPETIVYAVSDGYALALDGQSGTPLWHIPIGLGASFLPQSVPGEATVLVFDTRWHDLLKLDARTGSLKWRLALGEPVRDPPLVFGNQLAQVLPGGKLLLIDLKSGELQSTVNLGRPLARTPALDELGQHLYLLGRQDCLFILARDPLGCVAVEYLGHLDDAIPCAPARVGRFLIIPENDTLTESRWHILVLDEDGAHVKPVEDVEVSGWTWDTPAGSGSIVWATGDKGGYEAFAVGEYSSKNPFRSIARLTPDASASGPAFAMARSERELWVASGHSGSLTLDPERQSIRPKAPLAPSGPALAPIQKAGGIMVLTFQDQDTGGIALLGVDSDSGSIAWQTIAGAPWPTPLFSAPGTGVLASIGRDGREVSISEADIARGGFVAMTLPRTGDFALPQGTRLAIETASKPLTAIVSRRSSDVLWVQQPDKPPGWRKLTLPSPLAAEPLGWGGGVLVPGSDTRAYLIDPVSARSRAEPFVPKFDRDHQSKWLAPALLDRDTVVLADAVGRVRTIALRSTPVPRLIREAETDLDQGIIADPASSGGAVIVATADGRVRALAARDLSPVGSWPLGAPLTSAPVGASDMCFVMDRSGGVMAFAGDGRRAWSVNLGAEAVGSPILRDQSAWFLTRDGTLHVRARSDGAELKRRALGILPSGGVIAAGKTAVIAAGRATIRALLPEPAPEHKP
jgi:outer membrane protein assembly factor BamB